MARLDARERSEIPTKEFAGPDRSYPINDKDHGRAALSRVSQFGTPELKARVTADVRQKYPDMGKG